MSLSIDLEVDLGPAQGIMEFLKELGYTKTGIELRDKGRKDGAKDNVDIIEEFEGPTRVEGGKTFGGRDFFARNKAMDDHIRNVYEREIEKAIRRYEKDSGARRGMSGTIKQQSKLKALSKEKWEEKGRNLANNAHKKGLKEALLYWMELVVSRIEQQKTADGDAPRELGKGYRAFKKKKFGFEEPIGKASGQLLDNLSSTGSIRYTK